MTHTTHEWVNGRRGSDASISGHRRGRPPSRMCRARPVRSQDELQNSRPNGCGHRGRPYRPPIPVRPQNRYAAKLLSSCLSGSSADTARGYAPHIRTYVHPSSGKAFGWQTSLSAGTGVEPPPLSGGSVFHHPLDRGSRRHRRRALASPLESRADSA